MESRDDRRPEFFLVRFTSGAKAELEGRGGANRLFRGANRKNDKGEPFSLFSDLKMTGAGQTDGGGDCAPRPL